MKLKQLKKFIIAFILTFVIIYSFFYNKNTKKGDKIITKHKKSEYIFFQNGHKTDEPYKISENYISKPTNDEMSLSVFVKVNNWYENFDSWKHILHKGSKIEPESGQTFKSMKYQCPGLWFHPKVNDLRFVLSVYKDFDFKHKYCDITNIPIGKYFHIVFIVEGNTMSIFINKRLVKTCVFKGIPILTEGDIYVSHGRSYNGTMKNLQIFNTALSIEDIEDIYSKYY